MVLQFVQLLRISNFPGRFNSVTILFRIDINRMKQKFFNTPILGYIKIQRRIDRMIYEAHRKMPLLGTGISYNDLFSALGKVYRKNKSGKRSSIVIKIFPILYYCKLQNTTITINTIMITLVYSKTNGNVLLNDWNTSKLFCTRQAQTTNNKVEA